MGQHKDAAELADVTRGSLSLELGEQSQVCRGRSPNPRPPSCEPRPPAALGPAAPARRGQLPAGSRSVPALPVLGRLDLPDLGARLRDPGQAVHLAHRH